MAVSGTNQTHACACGSDPESANSGRSNGMSLAQSLDVSLARSDATRSEVESFLAISGPSNFRSICVQPRWASLAVRNLGGKPTRVASYVAYPHGTSLTPAKCAEAESLLRLGVEELWMVADIGALRAGDLDAAYIDIRAVAQVAECRGAHLNVILELPLLTARRGVEACVVAKLAGATSAASSTGCTGYATEPHHIELMRGALGEDMGVVASGGIRTVAMAHSLLAAGANRIETRHDLELAGPSRA